MAAEWGNRDHMDLLLDLLDRLVTGLERDEDDGGLIDLAEALGARQEAAYDALDRLRFED